MAYEATVDEVLGDLRFGTENVPQSSSDPEVLDEDDIDRWIQRAKDILDLYAAGSAADLTNGAAVGHEATWHYAMYRSYLKKGLDYSPHLEEWNNRVELVKRRARDVGGMVDQSAQATANNDAGAVGRWSEGTKGDFTGW